MNNKIKEYYYCFAIAAQANKPTFKLEYSSPIQTELINGLQIRRASSSARSVNGNPLVNDNVLGSSFLTLKQRSNEVLEKIPFELIVKATENGLWYEVDLPCVDMAQSEILVTNIAALVDDEDFELIIRYKEV